MVEFMLICCVIDFLPSKSVDNLVFQLINADPLQFQKISWFLKNVNLCLLHKQMFYLIYK